MITRLQVALCAVGVLVGASARADDDADSAQIKKDARHLGHTIRDAAKSVAKDAVHISKHALNKADRKLSGQDGKSEKDEK